MKIEDVYREVAPKLQSYLTGNGCSYATACDIVQETFLRLWKRRQEISDDLHQVSGLAFAIARNYRNDLHRKNRLVAVSTADRKPGEAGSAEVCLVVPGGPARGPLPGEESDETAVLRRRLKATLGRMPVQLLETFALARLGKLSVKEIARGTGTSEANVKVRVHRARELFKACFSDSAECVGGASVPAEMGSAVLKAMMMLAAVDGEIAHEELSLYRKLAQEFRGEDAAAFDLLWEESVRAMAYVGFLSEMLPPEEIVREYVREAGRIPGEFIAVLKQMASADGDYSRIERDCVSALARNSLQS